MNIYMKIYIQCDIKEMFIIVIQQENLADLSLFIRVDWSMETMLRCLHYLEVTYGAHWLATEKNAKNLLWPQEVVCLRSQLET